MEPGLQDGVSSGDRGRCGLQKTACKTLDHGKEFELCLQRERKGLGKREGQAMWVFPGSSPLGVLVRRRDLYSKPAGPAEDGPVGPAWIWSRGVGVWWAKSIVSGVRETCL